MQMLAIISGDIGSMWQTCKEELLTGNHSFPSIL